MKFLILLTLMGLSCQQGFEYINEFKGLYPLRAKSILHGQIQDPVTNETHKILGSVAFEQVNILGNVTVKVDIHGLPTTMSSVLKGLHIHAYGILNATYDVQAKCASTGPHYNPYNTTHGSAISPVRHDGDLGNVPVNADGSIQYVYQVAGLELFGPFSIIGRSVVLHEKEDDFGVLDTQASKTTGSSGSRIACGVIGWDASDSNAVEKGFFSESMLFLDIQTSIVSPNTFGLFKTAEMGNNWLDMSMMDQSSPVVLDVNEVVEPLDDSINMFPVDKPMFENFYNYLLKQGDSLKTANNEKAKDVFADKRQKLVKSLLKLQ